MALVDIILIVISALLWLAGERFLPVLLQETQLENRRRHFYSILLAVFSLAIGFTLKASFQIPAMITGLEKQITAVETDNQHVQQLFVAVTDSHMKEHFKDIFVSYHRDFKHPAHSPLLESWVNRAIVDLSTEMNQISISLPSSAAMDEVLALYDLAERDIVATHVGSIKKYFDNEQYKNKNRFASQRDIAVVRFYLFDGELTKTVGNDNVIVETYAKHGVTLTDYNEDVTRLHEEMGTLYSVVIPPDKLDARQRRDLLMVDGQLLVETVFGTGTTRATGNDTAVTEARSFLRTLLETTVPSEYVHYLERETIRKRYGRYDRAIDVGSEESMAERNGLTIAKSIARHLLNSTDG